MLTQKNLPCLAPFPSMTHRVDVSLQPKILRPPITPTIIPQTLSDSPKLPRPPPKPKPPIFVPKPTDSIPSELTPTPQKHHHQNYSFDPKDSAPGFGTGPRTQAKNSRDYTKHTEYNLEVRSTKLVRDQDTPPPPPSTPSSTPDPQQQQPFNFSLVVE